MPDLSTTGYLKITQPASNGVVNEFNTPLKFRLEGFNIVASENISLESSETEEVTNKDYQVDIEQVKFYYRELGSTDSFILGGTSDGATINLDGNDNDYKQEVDFCSNTYINELLGDYYLFKEYEYYITAVYTISRTLASITQQDTTTDEGGIVLGKVYKNENVVSTYEAKSEVRTVILHPNTKYGYLKTKVSNSEIESHTIFKKSEITGKTEYPTTDINTSEGVGSLVLVDSSDVHKGKLKIQSKNNRTLHIAKSSPTIRNSDQYWNTYGSYVGHYSEMYSHNDPISYYDKTSYYVKDYKGYYESHTLYQEVSQYGNMYYKYIATGTNYGKYTYFYKYYKNSLRYYYSRVVNDGYKKAYSSGHPIGSSYYVEYVYNYREYETSRTYTTSYYYNYYTVQQPTYVGADVVGQYKFAYVATYLAAKYYYQNGYYIYQYARPAYTSGYGYNGYSYTYRPVYGQKYQHYTQYNQQSGSLVAYQYLASIQYGTSVTPAFPYYYGYYKYNVDTKHQTYDWYDKSNTYIVVSGYYKYIDSFNYSYAKEYIDKYTTDSHYNGATYGSVIHYNYKYTNAASYVNDSTYNNDVYSYSKFYGR